MRFFVEIQNNQSVAHGRVGKQIDASHFFVRYDAPRKYSRIVSLTIMENFAMFDTEEELKEFLTPPAAPVTAPVDVPAGTPEDKKDAAPVDSVDCPY